VFCYTWDAFEEGEDYGEGTGGEEVSEVFAYEDCVKGN